MLMMLALEGWLHFARRLQLMLMMLALVGWLHCPKAADAHDARFRGVASLARRRLMLMMLALVGWLHLPETS